MEQAVEKKPLKGCIIQIFKGELTMMMKKTGKTGGKAMGGKAVKSPKQAMPMALVMPMSKMPMKGSRTAKNMKTKGMR